LIYSYVMNNYWHTNYKADQEGPVTFNYSIRPHTDFDRSDAVKFGVERRQPLIVAAANESRAPRDPLMHLSADVLVSLVKPIAGGKAYNPSNKAQRVGLQWSIPTPPSVRSSNAAGEVGSSAQDFELTPLGSAYLRVDEQSP